MLARINEKVTRASVRGTLGLWRIDHKGVWHPVSRTKNLLMYGWGHIAARQIGRSPDAAALDYAVKGFYLEFENVADPGDPVTIPSFGRGDGISYYDGLSASGTLDFLRVALRGQPELGISASLAAQFVEGVSGNKLTFFTQSVGATGIHGKTFSDSVNSKIYGAALVATPVLSDRTQDEIFSRAYVQTSEQTLKDASSQVGASWEIEFI